MLEIIKKKFIVLLISIVNASIHARCISLSNQKWEIQPTLINLHPNENNQEFHYYPFAVILDRCAGRCNVLNDLSSNVCVPNKTDDLNLSVFNIVTGINKSKTLTNLVSSKCKCKLDRKKCNSNQWWNNGKCWCECNKHNTCEKDCI